MSLLSNALSIDKHDQEVRETVEKFKNQVTTADCQPYSSDWKKKIVSKCDKAQDIVKAKFNKNQSQSLKSIFQNFIAASLARIQNNILSFVKVSSP